MQHTWQVVLAWFTQHESLLIFIAIFLEESGIPMPIPADIAMALAGHRVAQGTMSLLQAFLIGQVATLLGSSILYWLGRRGGRPLLFRYGKLLHLTAHRLSQVERLITRLGPLAVIIGRQIPGLRLAAPLACGVFRVPYWQFMPAMIIGSSVYIGIFLALGMWGGTAAVAALQAGGAPVRFVVSSLLLILAAVILRQLSRRAKEVVAPAYRVAASHRRSLEAALIAGLGASALMALSIIWLLALATLVARRPPDPALLQFLERSSIALPIVDAGLSRQRLLIAGLIATVPFEVLTHLIWAAVYAFAFERRLRGTAGIRGLQFSVLPWLCSGLVIFPLLGVGPFGIRVGAGFLPAIGELVRHAVYGMALGSLYRLVRLARQPRLHEGYRHGHRHAPATSEPATNDVLAPLNQAAAHAPDPLARYASLDTAVLQRIAARGDGATNGTTRAGRPAPPSSARPSGPPPATGQDAPQD